MQQDREEQVGPQNICYRAKPKLIKRKKNKPSNTHRKNCIFSLIINYSFEIVLMKNFHHLVSHTMHKNFATR